MDHRPGDRWRENGADRRPAEESGEAQHADDEALAVTGHGEGGREHNQDQVKQITRHVPTV